MDLFSDISWLTILIIAVLIVGGWFLLRSIFHLTMSVFRIGCFVIFLVVAVALLLTIL